MPGKYLHVAIHLIWSTAHREACIEHEWQDPLYGYLGGVLKNKSSKLICAGGTADHLHLLVSFPSTSTIAQIVNALKANSSRCVHETIANQKDFAWQSGYGAFSVSKSAEQNVIDYIQSQETHHGKQDFKTEFLEFLQKHGVKYDERYLWD
jgi:putative transposase